MYTHINILYIYTYSISISDTTFIPTCSESPGCETRKTNRSRTPLSGYPLVICDIASQHGHI